MSNGSVAPAPPLADAEARERIEQDLGATLFVEAAAGTGKTRSLVARIVALLRAGHSELDRMVAVTFTEKAAGEMKLRLRAEIEKARSAEAPGAAPRQRLDRALEQLELARIGTLHAFCGDLLRERPVEAGVDPRFEVAPEDESARLLDEAFERWFQAELERPGEGVRRVLRRRPTRFDAPGPRELLRNAVTSLADHRDFPAPWRRNPFDREAEIDSLVETLRAAGALAERAASSGDYLARNLAEVQDFITENDALERVRGRDYDGLEAALRGRATRFRWHWRGSPRRPYAADLARNDVIATRDAAKARLDGLLEACDADLAPLLREELRPVIEDYERRKQRAGKLDFLDLLVGARDLIRGDMGVRAELQERFSHFFIDEFQDTDPLQAELLLLLAADDPAQTDWREVSPLPGKLFVVGDPKQSIYRFRRADVAVYEAVKQQLCARGGALLHLRTSFRSRPALQALVNACFAPVMPTDDTPDAPARSQARYVPLEPFRPDPSGQPAVIALPIPRPYSDYGKIVNFRVDASAPDAVGAFVAWLIEESGFTVEERDQPGVAVPLAPRHVCLLFRRFKSFGNDVTRPYVRALEARRIPHVLVGGRSFHDREEVLAVRNALAAIEWPDDELRIYATLRGPLFAIGDDALLAYRHQVGRLHTLRPMSDAALAALDPGAREAAGALAVLGELHRERNRRPIAETVSRLLHTVRAHAGLAIWPTGEQALANVLRTLDVARRFERRGARSFRGFVERLEAEAERGEAAEAPVVEEGTEGVRIMTVHRAKGLEFPVVVLADPTCRASTNRPSRHVDAARGLFAEPLCGCLPPDLLDAREDELRRDGEEAVRIAYVAATRARDLLVVPAVGDEARPGWLEVLNPGLYPPFERRREAADAEGCPPFGEDSVLERPERSERGPTASVRPGRHRPRSGSHEVVWWDPAQLQLDVTEEVGLRQQKILAADDPESDTDAAAKSVRDHRRWSEGRAALLEAGSQPTWVARSVTALSEGDGVGSNEEAEVVLERVETRVEPRPSGRRFGTLVHAVLAEIDLDAASTSEIARSQGRLLGAAPEEVEAAAVCVKAALAHPLLRRAAAAAARGALRREAPLVLRLGDGTLAEGIVDLALREDGPDGPSWTVVDFKTDYDLEERRSHYEAQVRLYTRAISEATGEPARGVLLLV